MKRVAIPAAIDVEAGFFTAMALQRLFRRAVRREALLALAGGEAPSFTAGRRHDVLSVAAVM